MSTERKSPAINPRDYIVEPNAVVEDIDLDEEIVLDSNGNRITEAVAQEMAAAAVRKVRGRSRMAAEMLADAVEDYLFTEARDEQALRAAWQRYVDEMAKTDGRG